MKKRHVTFAELGMWTADGFGHPNETDSLTDLLNAPPLARRGTNELLALLVYQQSAAIKLLRDELPKLRKAIQSSQAIADKAREKAAKAEEKAANARERAAVAEAQANAAAQPTLLIQAGDSWQSLEDRIRRKF